MDDEQPGPTNLWLRLPLTHYDVQDIATTAIMRRLKALTLEDARVTANFFADVLKAEGLSIFRHHFLQWDNNDFTARDGVLGTGPTRWFCRTLEAEDPAGEAEIQQFLADRPEGQLGIVLSVTGFELSALKMAKQADVRTIDDREFGSLIIKHYQSLDPDQKDAIPMHYVLAPAWWMTYPVEDPS